MTSSLFGVLLLDREPLGLANVPGLAFAWLQDAGGFAALGLALYLINALVSPADQPASAKLRKPVTRWMVFMAVLCLITYSLLLAAWILGIGKVPDSELPPKLQPGEAMKYMPPRVMHHAQPVLLALAGLFAMLGIGHPFARDMFKLRFRRIYALIKVCFLEALRNKVFFVFLIYMLVFLFPANWFSSIKPEDELRTPIAIFSVVKNLLLTIPFLILAAFAIPTDIKTNTLYTIVTKPVERFEIVLGRFLGYGGLMTIALFGMVTLSVIYIETSRFDEKAREESYKARVTDRGKLSFQAFRSDYAGGTNVGREFDYRRYIGGSPHTRERAVWTFDNVPGNLVRRDRDSVPVEFTFDIFRLTKGVENQGLLVNIRVCAWQCGQVPSPKQGDGVWRWANELEGEKYEAERQAINDKLKIGGNGSGFERSLDFAKPGTPTWDLADQLARKYGFFEVPNVEAFDYRPGSIAVPVGLFEKASEGDPKTADGKPLPRVTIYVKCLSPGQMLGMAEADLYIVEGEKSFAENYFKSALGLWCRLLIVIGLAVTFSTYFPALIAAFATCMLYILAYFSEHIQDIASRTSVGGGPFESSLRAIRGESPTMPLDNTGAMGAIMWGDDFFAWFIRRFTNVIPDVDAFVWSEFLAEGFNVNFEYLIVNLLILVGYLLPWGVLSYYLINNREVAA